MTAAGNTFVVTCADSDGGDWTGVCELSGTRGCRRGVAATCAMKRLENEGQWRMQAVLPARLDAACRWCLLDAFQTEMLAMCFANPGVFKKN
jgi:hypothetical protein